MPRQKRIKVEGDKHAYAELDFETGDDVSVERNTDHLKKEIAKPKPKAEVVKQLIRRTIKARRNSVMSGDRPEVILDSYPHLRKITFVSALMYIASCYVIMTLFNS